MSSSSSISVPLVIGVGLVGLAGIWLFTRQSVGKSLGGGAADVVSSFSKGLYKDIGKPIGKEIEKGAVVVFKKGLKPIGEGIWKKALKPSIKGLKQAPKKVANALNPKKNGVSKAFKKAFHF